MRTHKKKVSGYNKWGYIFLIPFTVVFILFQLIPLANTIYNSFFENYMSGLTQIGPRFVGLGNYIKLFESGDIWIYTRNTLVLWIMCFIPQIFLSLLLGAWFSAEGFQIFQNGHLPAEPYYGIRFCNAVLHPVFRQRPDQLPADAA